MSLFEGCPLFRSRIYGLDVPPLHPRHVQGAPLPPERVRSSTLSTATTIRRWAVCANTCRLHIGHSLSDVSAIAGIPPFSGFFSKDEDAGGHVLPSLVLGRMDDNGGGSHSLLYVPSLLPYFSGGRRIRSIRMATSLMTRHGRCRFPSSFSRL